jgi:hypothetical protein
MARGMILWLVIMLVETTHGVLRGLFLAPHLGESNAARVGWPIGLLLVLRGLDGPALLAAIDPRTGSVFYSAIVMFLAPVLAWRLSRPAP